MKLPNPFKRRPTNKPTSPLRFKPRYLLIFAAILLLTLIPFAIFRTQAPEPANAQWYDAGGGSGTWVYRKKITIDNTKVSGSSNLTNFPVMINSGIPDLVGKAQTDAGDLVFTSSDGTTKLDHEIATYDSTSGRLTAYVEIPSLSYNTDTVIYMYYGNPTVTDQENITGTWNSNYLAVYHLNEGDSTDSGFYKNSSSTSSIDATLTDADGDTIISQGKIDQALDFNGDDDKIIPADNAIWDLNRANDYTWELWINPDDFGEWGTLLGHIEDSSTYVLAYAHTSASNPWNVTAGIAVCWYDSSSVIACRQSTNNSLVQNQWNHVVITYDASDTDGDEFSIFTNGVNRNNGSGGSSSASTISSAYVSLADNNEYAGEEYNGSIDEFRFMNIEMSADWLATTYANQNAPNAFYQIGDEVVNTDPIAHWGFDEQQDNTCSGGTNDACDRIGGHDGAFTSISRANEPMCILGGCIQLNADTDQVVVADHDDLHFSGENFSVSMWVRPTSYEPNLFPSLIAKREAFGTMDWELYHDSATDEILLYVGESAAALLFDGDGATLTTDQWNFVTLTKSGNDYSLYINGKLEASETSSQTWTDSDDIVIGNLEAGNSYATHGFFDEVKIFPYALSQSQILAQYNNGAVVLGTQDPQDLNRNLIGYWPMDEEAGNGCVTATADNCDKTGSNQDLIWNADTTTAVGKFGQGSTFDGTGDYSYAALDDNGFLARWAFSVWFKTTDTASFLLDTGRDGVSSRIALLTDGSDTLWVYYSDYDGSTLTVKDYHYSVTSTDGNWHHAIVTRDGPNSISLYVDGVKRSPSVITTDDDISIISGDKHIDLTLGLRYSGGTYPLSGQLDEVRFYSRAFYEPDAQALYKWAPGPVVYYDLNDWANSGPDNVEDRSGYGNTGSKNGSMTIADLVPGKVGNGYDFDGSNDYISILTAADSYVDFNSGQAFSASAWIYVKSMPPSTDADMIIGKWDQDSTQRAYRLALLNDDSDSTGALLVRFRDESAGQNLNTSSATDSIATNTWYHVAFTYNGGVAGAAGDVKLYINGVYVAQNTANASFLGIEDSTADFTIGDYDPTDTNSASTAFHGIIDEVRVYNYEQNAEQIIRDYNGGHPAPGSPVGSHVAYWKFDELTGITAYDDSLGDNDLTLSTASWTGSGKFDGAFNGDGSAYLSRADDADFDFNATESFAISAWVKSDSTSNPGAAEGVVTKVQKESQPGYALYFNTSGQVCIGIDDDTSWGPDISSCSSADIYDATWHHVIGVRNISTDQTMLFVDGALVDSDSDTTTATLENSYSLYLADFDGTDNGDEFNGNIDEVKIFRTSIDTNQAKILANSGAINLGRGTSLESDYSGVAFASPTLWWKLDDNSGTTALDSSGNGKSGTLTNSPIWTIGKFGSAVSFAGSNQHIIRADDDDLDAAVDTLYTVSFWFKHSTATAQEFIFSKYNEAGIKIAMESDGDISCSQDFDSTWTPLASAVSTAATYDDGKWHHAVCSFQTSSSITLHIDGIQVGTASHGPDFASSLANSDPLYIGINADGTSNDFVGQLDDLRIFNGWYAYPYHAVHLYNQGEPFLWYQFDECSGTTLYNSVENAHGEALGSNGTLEVGSGGTTSAGSCDTSGTWYNGASGKLSYSLDFDGNDDVVSVSNASIIDQNEGLQNGLTIATWVYANSDGEGDVGRIFTKNTNTWCRTDSQGTTDLDLECSLDLSTDATLNIADALTTNTWHHVALAWTNDADDEITIYVDGVARGTSTDGVGDASADTATLYIGGNNTAASNTAAFDGQLDDFRIFPYELSAAQIKKVMLGGKAGAAASFSE